MEHDGKQTSASPAADWRKEAFDWLKALVVAGVLVFVIRAFFFSPYIVDGDSMEPNFQGGERVIVNKILYSIRNPERGEVVVFRSPYNADYIKRVIALPGETVQVAGDTVYINGEPLPEPYLQDVLDEFAAAGETYNNKNFETQTVPEGYVFVMGDNRPNSHDSRSSDIGFIEFDEIIGRADVVIWPLERLRFVSHEVGGR